MVGHGAQVVGALDEAVLAPEGETSGHLLVHPRELSAVLPAEDHGVGAFSAEDHERLPFEELAVREARQHALGQPS